MYFGLQCTCTRKHTCILAYNVRVINKDRRQIAGLFRQNHPVQILFDKKKLRTEKIKISD